MSMVEGGRRCSVRLKSRCRASNEPPLEELPIKKQRLSSKRVSKWIITSETTSTNENESQSTNKVSQPKLNDKCLQKVLEHMDLKTLCSAADVCKKLRQFSTAAFSNKFNHLDSDKIDRLLFRRVMRKFGVYISSILFTQTTLAPDDVFIMNKYCVNLHRLSLTMMRIKCNDFQPIFARLNTLCMIECDLDGDRNQMFAACTRLVDLTIDAKKYNDIPRCLFPRLSVLRFECESSWKWSYLWHLLKRNPQIECLHIVAYPDDEVIQNIVQNTKRLEALFIEPGVLSKPPKVQSMEGLIQLAKLKSLKQLSVHTGDGNYSIHASALANELSTKRVAIDLLCLDTFEIVSHDLRNILKLNALKKLALVSMERLNDSELKLIAKQLTLLEKLRIDIDFNEKAMISNSGLVDMIRCAKNLTYLGLNGIRNIKIDQNTFNSMVSAVKQRKIGSLKIAIIGCRTTTEFNVPQKIQLEHRSMLQIDYQFDNDYECECEHCMEPMLF